jgi:4'-phosphopantetheinyl transferase
MSAEWPTGPDRPEVPSDEVHVWRADLGPVAARELRSAGRNALRRALGRYLDREPAAIELTGGEHGKPALAGERPPPLRFNLSHSGELALIAVTAEREVGVDVELAAGGRDVMRLAEAGLAPEEAAAVRSAPRGARAAAFYSAWVRKEAVAKCLGVGLGAPLPPTPVSVSMLDVDEGYSAALAIAGPRPSPIRRYSLPAGDRAYFF